MNNDEYIEILEELVFSLIKYYLMLRDMIEDDKFVQEVVDLEKRICNLKHCQRGFPGNRAM